MLKYRITVIKRRERPDADSWLGLQLTRNLIWNLLGYERLFVFESWLWWSFTSPQVDFHRKWIFRRILETEEVLLISIWGVTSHRWEDFCLQKREDDEEESVRSPLNPQCLSSIHDSLLPPLRSFHLFSPSFIHYEAQTSHWHVYETSSHPSRLSAGEAEQEDRIYRSCRKTRVLNWFCFFRGGGWK